MDEVNRLVSSLEKELFDLKYKLLLTNSVKVPADLFAGLESIINKLSVHCSKHNDKSHADIVITSKEMDNIMNEIDYESKVDARQNSVTTIATTNDKSIKLYDITMLSTFQRAKPTVQTNISLPVCHDHVTHVVFVIHSQHLNLHVLYNT